MRTHGAEQTHPQRQKAQQRTGCLLTYGLALPEADVEQRVALLRAHVVNHVFDAQLSLLTRQKRCRVINACSSQQRTQNDALAVVH